MVGKRTTITEDAKQTAVVNEASLARLIYRIRGINVMLDADLARLYEVQTKVLLQAVKRNISRFPEDFMFQLTKGELENWRSHFVAFNPSAKMGLRRRPYVFTEQGVAMLSSVLRSERAIQVNIEIMRAFVHLKQLISSNEKLAKKIAALEKKYDDRFKVVFDAIRQLMIPPEKEKRPIGFASWPKEDGDNE